MILAFVYLGDTLPKYVLANMSIVASRFPDNPLVFIGDSKSICDRVLSRGFIVWQSKDPEFNWGITRNSMAHDPHFRSGFWFKTIARFFALNEYLKTLPDDSCLLIESDVWLSPKFPMSKFQLIQHEIAFPLTTPSQGVASTFFVRDSESLQKFIDFSELRVREDPTSTDVSILAEYYSKHPDRTCILPSGPVNSAAYNEGFSVQDQKLLSSQSVFERQIFDGSTWGQFITGEDPRNSWGFRNVYQVQKHHAVDPSKATFKWDNGTIVASVFGEDYQIHSLHVHSKDIRVFKKQNFVEHRVVGFTGNSIKELVLRYFVRFIPSRVVFEGKRGIKALVSRIT